MWYWKEHVLRSVFILTYHGLHFSKDLWPKLNSLCSCLNISYNYVCVMSRKCLMWGSWSLEPLLNFSTSFWLEEDLVLLCQKFCNNPFTTSELHIRAWKPSNEGLDICLTIVKLFSSRTIPMEWFDIQSYNFGCRLKKAKGSGAFVHDWLWQHMTSCIVILWTRFLPNITKCIYQTYDNIRTWFRTIYHLYP